MKAFAAWMTGVSVLGAILGTLCGAVWVLLGHGDWELDLDGDDL